MQTQKAQIKKFRTGVAYIRCFSGSQDTESNFEAQLSAIRTRAAQDKVYSDTQKAAEYRLGIRAILDDAKSRDFSVLYCYGIDRLSRNLFRSIKIIKELRENDVVIKTIGQNFDLETPEGNLVFHLLASLRGFWPEHLDNEE